MKHKFVFLCELLILGSLVSTHFLGFHGLDEQNKLQPSNPFDKLEYSNEGKESSINMLQISPPSPNEVADSKRTSTPINSNFPDDVKCSLCNQVYQNKFDYQIMIDQKKCDSQEDIHHQAVDKFKCVEFIRQVARKFFNDGGDDIFEGDLYEKVKFCREAEEGLRSNGLYTNADLKSKGCDRLGAKACDILLENKFNQCSAPVQQGNIDYIIQTNFLFIYVSFL